MEIIDVISRIVHVGTAITLVGGTAFMWLVLLPSASRLDRESHDLLAAEVKSRWKRFVHLGIVLFLVSGFYNFYRALPAHKGDGLYHGIVGTKILLALVVFFIASALVGRSAKLQPMRDNKGRWMRLAVLLATIIVVLSGYVKVRGPRTKADESEQPVAIQASASTADVRQPDSEP